MVPDWRLHIWVSQWWRRSVCSYLQLFLLLVNYSGANRMGSNPVDNWCTMAGNSATWRLVDMYYPTTSDRLCLVPNWGALGKCSIPWCYRMQWAKDNKCMAAVLPFQHPQQIWLRIEHRSLRLQHWWCQRMPLMVRVFSVVQPNVYLDWYLFDFCLCGCTLAFENFWTSSSFGHNFNQLKVDSRSSLELVVPLVLRVCADYLLGK